MRLKSPVYHVLQLDRTADDSEQSLRCAESSLKQAWLQGLSTLSCEIVRGIPALPEGAELTCISGPPWRWLSPSSSQLSAATLKVRQDIARV